MTEQNLLGIIDQFILKGYSEELIWEGDYLFAPKRCLKLNLDDIYIDAAFRFECSDRDEDCSAIFAISAPKFEIKGLLIDYFDEIGKKSDDPLVKKLIEKSSFKKEIDDNIEHRYNLRKIYKKDFELDPDRYVLRIKFPDFPNCPFGNSFKMLGYDKIEKTYVWFVTSILKDDRLTTETYKVC